MLRVIGMTVLRFFVDFLSVAGVLIGGSLVIYLIIGFVSWDFSISDEVFKFMTVVSRIFIVIGLLLPIIYRLTEKKWMVMKIEKD